MDFPSLFFAAPGNSNSRKLKEVGFYGHKYGKCSLLQKKRRSEWQKFPSADSLWEISGPYFKPFFCIICLWNFCLFFLLSLKCAGAEENCCSFSHFAILRLRRPHFFLTNEQPGIFLLRQFGQILLAAKMNRQLFCALGWFVIVIAAIHYVWSRGFSTNQPRLNLRLLLSIVSSLIKVVKKGGNNDCV